MCLESTPPYKDDSTYTAMVIINYEVEYMTRGEFFKLCEFLSKKFESWPHLNQLATIKANSGLTLRN
ncbi:hypothetical protein Plhal304r1_c017g0060551 [Plasmopara halstedii]